LTKNFEKIEFRLLKYIFDIQFYFIMIKVYILFIF